MTDTTGRPTTETTDEGGEAPCFAHLFGGDGTVSDAFLAQLVHGLADAVIVADPEGTIVYWNLSAERLFGWSAAEAVDRPLNIIIPERLRRRHDDGYRETMETGITRYADRLLEVPALHRDGHTFSIAFTVTLMKEAGHTEPFAIAAVMHDDTDHYQERRALKARVRELEQ